MRTLAVLYNLLLVPGVGQVAIGRWRRGLPWLIGLALSPVLALVVPWGFLVLFLGTRIGAAVEVALLAPREPAREVKAVAVYLGGLAAAITWFAVLRTFVVQPFKIPSGAMIPALEIGDHLFVNKLAYRLGEPARGDIAVFENPCEPHPDFVMRIVGLPGDTIEVRCDVLHVNGKPAPATSLREECGYWDRAEDGGAWVRETCTTYLEELDGRQYETVHPASRRDLDRLRKVAGREKPYEELRGDGDFPDADRLPACPGAGPALGRIEPSTGGTPGDACAPTRRYAVPAGHVFVMGDNRENSSDSRRWGPVPLDHLTGKVVSIWWSSKPAEQGGIAWDRIGPIE